MSDTTKRGELTEAEAQIIAHLAEGLAQPPATVGRLAERGLVTAAGEITEEGSRALWAYECSKVPFKVGDRVTFGRGMFGRWPGQIVKLYQAREGSWHQGKRMAQVRYTMRNGKAGTARVPVAELGRF